MSYDQLVWVMNFLNGVVQGLIDSGLPISQENLLNRIMKFRSTNLSPQVNQVCDLSNILVSTMMSPDIINVYNSLQEAYKAQSNNNIEKTNNDISENSNK